MDQYMLLRPVRSLHHHLPLIASSPETLVAFRESSSGNRSACSANLTTGWINWSPTEGPDPPGSRTSSAGLSAGGTQQQGSWYYEAPWNQNTDGTGQGVPLPEHRRPRTERQMVACKVSSF